MIERRKYVRLQAHLGLSYQAAHGLQEQQRRTIVRNLSGGGLCINVPDDLREGDLLQVQLEVPHLRSSVRAVAEVVWTTRQGAGRNNEVGLRFRDMSDQDLHHVLEYVHTVGIG